MFGRWRDRPRASLVALAAGSTAVWAGAQTLGSLGSLNDPLVHLAVEGLRSIAWLATVIVFLQDLDKSVFAKKAAMTYGVLFLAAAATLTGFYVTSTNDSFVLIGTVISGVVLSAMILLLVEQLYRNAPFDTQSGLKYLCVGLIGLFTYDLVIFLLAIVNREMSINQWAARGYLNAIFVVPLGLAAQRSFRLSLDAHLPRQIIFYSFGLLAIGIVIVFMIAGDYYIRIYGGTWGGTTRIVLFGAALVFIAVALISATTRARVRVFLMKSFFQYKYDYRKEWLRFISTLSDSKLDSVANTAVRAVAQIVNSPGGAVWVQDPEGRDYLPIGIWQTDVPINSSVSHEARMVRFLRQRQWVVDMNELEEHPSRYDDFRPEPWVTEDDRWWLIVPLFLGSRLFGFVLLQRPRVVPSLNFEDHDLLKTVGRHVATHINQAESDRRLAESSQFGTYNRLTAFLMHDLNNLIAQQSMVVKNAEKYRHNPQFVDDAIDTIANSVSRMRRLMAQLSSNPSQSVHKRVDLANVIKNAVQRVTTGNPIPVVNMVPGKFFLEADSEKLTSMVEHLLRNAQDATASDGTIDVNADTEGTTINICIADSGHGMTAEFIRERLFRPFDSTKGSQSMGIGAYQAREYVRELGGQLDVTSTVGEGTVFTIRLPLAR
jgi:putative PEP-CTERM system histidine kinase